MNDDTIQQVTLRDGSAVEVRQLRQSDRAELAYAIEHLSPETRYLRFAAAKPTVSERELDFLVDVDHHGREALIAIDPDSRHGIGVARYVQIPEEPSAVELAVTISDQWQGRGLGGTLIAMLLERARAEGYTAVRASVLAHNSRSIAMLRRVGFAAHGGAGVMREFELPLAVEWGATE